MFVGEAPGFHEDKQGYPFVGQAGKLLDKLLAGIGLERANVYIANVLKCRPPGNRDPAPDEIEACEGHLFRQIELIQPRVVATLGNFATKLLSGKPTGITRVHGAEQEVTLGGRRVLLYPLYHPAAALYTPAMLKVLEAGLRAPPRAARARRPRRRRQPRRCSLRSRPSRGRPARPLLGRGDGDSRSASPAETEAIAAALAPGLRAGDVVTVSGELGAGKTTFVRGACRALGVDGAGDEPDLHDRPPLPRRRRSTSRTSTSTASRASRRRSGATSSRTSTTRSASSSGPRRRPTPSRRSASRYVCRTWTPRID